MSPIAIMVGIGYTHPTRTSDVSPFQQSQKETRVVHGMGAYEADVRLLKQGLMLDMVHTCKLTVVIELCKGNGLKVCLRTSRPSPNIPVKHSKE